MIVLFVVLMIAISIFLGGVFAIKFKDRLHLILGFSAGAVLSLALFELLPESIELVTGAYSIRIVTILIATGFSVYMLIDRLLLLSNHYKIDRKGFYHKGIFGVLILVLHSFLDGIGIGFAFKVSPAVGWAVATAVLAHNFSDGINTVCVAMRDNATRKATIKWLTTVAIAPAFGVIATYFIAVPSSNLGLILAFFAGLFIYLGASDLIPESHHRHPVIWTTLMTIIGMAFIGFIIFIIN